MSYKILIVDDSKLARMSVVKALKSLQPDWPRLEAANFSEALSISESSPPDLAVLDFNMPGRDGLELAAELHQKRPDMPIAVISANHQQEVIDRATALNAYFLAKPLTEAAMNEFLALAKEQIKKART